MADSNETKPAKKPGHAIPQALLDHVPQKTQQDAWGVPHRRGGNQTVVFGLTQYREALDDVHPKMETGDDSLR